MHIQDAQCEMVPSALVKQFQAPLRNHFLFFENPVLDSMQLEVSCISLNSNNLLDFPEEVDGFAFSRNMSG